jgi:hypothetical protein
MKSCLRRGKLQLRVQLPIYTGFPFNTQTLKGLSDRIRFKSKISCDNLHFHPEFRTLLFPARLLLGRNFTLLAENQWSVQRTYFFILIGVLAGGLASGQDFDRLVLAEQTAARSKVNFTPQPKTSEYDIHYHRLE